MNKNRFAGRKTDLARSAPTPTAAPRLGSLDVFLLSVWCVLFLGVASRLVPALERHPAALRRIVIASLPGLLGLVIVLAGFVFGGDWLKRHRESGRPSPSAAAPNVLLIVLDTVRADHLS